MSEEPKQTNQESINPELLPNISGDVRELAALAGLVQPFAMTLTEASKSQADAVVKQAEFAYKQAELAAKGARVWNLGVLVIIGAFAFGALAMVFMGKDAIGEKLIFGVIGFFGGYGASLVARK